MMVFRGMSTELQDAVIELAGANVDLAEIERMLEHGKRCGLTLEDSMRIAKSCGWDTRTIPAAMSREMRRKPP
jgi:hypothetical protein